MNIDPKQIARMISEDPDEVVPSDHFDDTEDEYVAEPGFCDGCLRDIDYDFLNECEKCGYWWCQICMGKRSGFDYNYYGVRQDMISCPNCIKNKS